MGYVTLLLRRGLGFMIERSGPGCHVVMAATPLRKRYVPGSSLRMTVLRSSAEGHLVNALALRGDEGRSTLRYATGSCEQTLIRGFPNGETRPYRVIVT